MPRNNRNLNTQAGEPIGAQWESRLADLLSPAARGERRLLLFLSTVSLLFVFVGLFPTKIEALGLTFEGKDRAAMVLLLAAVNAYALVGFLFYGWADWHLLRRTHGQTTTGYIDEFLKGRATWFESANYYGRILFDFVVPIGYGIYALWKIYEAWSLGTI